MASFRDILLIERALPLCGTIRHTAVLVATPADALSYFRQLVMWPALAAAFCPMALCICVVAFRCMRQFRHFLQTSEAAIRAKARFLRGLSEELRAPMSDLVSMTDFLASCGAVDDKAQTAQIIRNSAHSLLDMLTKLLEYTQLDDGSIQTQRTDFDLHGLMEDTTCRFSKSAHAKGLRLSCCISPRVPALVRGDPVLLDRLLSLLLENAIRATSQGDVCLTVRMSAEDVHSLSLSFEVLDTGVGIPPSRQKQMLRQDWAPRAKEPSGTGLGLAIVQLIASRFHGHLDLHSEEGKGSTFWALLRLERASIKEPALQRLTLPAGLQTCVISASASVRKMTSWKLALLGVRCLSLETAEFLPDNTAILFVDGHPLSSVPSGTLQVSLVRPGSGEPVNGPSLALPLRLSEVLALLIRLSDHPSRSGQLANLAEQVQRQSDGARKMDEHAIF